LTWLKRTQHETIFLKIELLNDLEEA